MELIRRKDEEGNEIKPPVIPSIILGTMIVVVVLLQVFGIIS